MKKRTVGSLNYVLLRNEVAFGAKQRPSDKIDIEMKKNSILDEAEAELRRLGFKVTRGFHTEMIDERELHDA